jgi:hypothetical protein
MHKRPREQSIADFARLPDVVEFTKITTTHKLQLADPEEQRRPVNHIDIVGVHTLQIGGVVFLSAPLQVRSKNWGRIQEVAHFANTTRVEFTEDIHDPTDIHAVAWYIPPTDVLYWKRLKTAAIEKQDESNKVSAVQMSRNEIRPRPFCNVSEPNILERTRARLRKKGLTSLPSPDMLDLMAWADDSSYTNALDVCLTSGSGAFFKRLDALVRKQPALTAKLVVYKGIKLGTFRMIRGVFISRKLAYMPMSTTPKFEVARRFAGDDGLVLKIELPVGEHVLDVDKHLELHDPYVEGYIRTEKELLVASGGSLLTTGDIQYSRGSVCMVPCTLIRVPALRERVRELKKTI